MSTNGPLRVRHAPSANGELLILDRDGVLIENRPDYVRAPVEVEFLSGAIDAVRRATHAGFAVGIATNQSMVGRGLVSTERALAIQELVVDTVAAGGGIINYSAICPHAPADSCMCRKPRPGLVTEILKLHGSRPQRLWFVGDAATDWRCAAGAGCNFLMVRTGRGAAELASLRSHQRRRIHAVSDLGEAVDLVIEEVFGSGVGS